MVFLHLLHSSYVEVPASSPMWKHMHSSATTSSSWCKQHGAVYSETHGVRGTEAVLQVLLIKAGHATEERGWSLRLKEMEAGPGPCTEGSCSWREALSRSFPKHRCTLAGTNTWSGLIKDNYFLWITCQTVPILSFQERQLPGSDHLFASLLHSFSMTQWKQRADAGD